MDIEESYELQSTKHSIVLNLFLIFIVVKEPALRFKVAHYLKFINKICATKLILSH